MPMNQSPDKLRILLSAYACAPHRGSEPGVGWNWTNGLADRVELQVITRESNRRTIEAFIEASPEDSPIRGVRFHYHDLSAWAIFLKKRRILPTSIYYLLWQVQVARRFADMAERVDIVHHLTFCSLLCPGYWRLRRSKSVIGPVGAPLVPASLLTLFGMQAPVQALRGLLMRNFHRIPSIQRVLRQARAIIPANADTRALLEARSFHAEAVLLDTGTPDIGHHPRGRIHHDDSVMFLYAGQLERRKGLELSLRALAMAESHNWRFKIVGEGPDRQRLQRLCGKLNIDGKVEFTGRISQQDVFKEMAQADVFLFSSLRDTSAGVNLEAMANGLPVICLCHQGVADITDNDCAERVAPGSLSATITGLAKAVDRMIADSQRREQMGRNAANRAKTEFDWQHKFDAIIAIYERTARTALYTATHDNV